MNEAWKGFLGFWRGTQSESDGSPSWSRTIGTLLALVVAYVIVLIFRKLFDQPTDKLALWLAALPWLIGALAGLISAPYLVNKGGNLVEVLSAFANRQQK